MLPGLRLAKKLLHGHRCASLRGSLGLENVGHFIGQRGINLVVGQGFVKQGRVDGWDGCKLTKSFGCGDQFLFLGVGDGQGGDGHRTV